MSDHNNRLRQKYLPILINAVHSAREGGAAFGHNIRAFFPFLYSVLMHSFSSNVIFHACDDSLKMRRNLPTEMIQIVVTEVPGQVRQTYFQSVTINSSTFHNMRFDHQALLGKIMGL